MINLPVNFIAKDEGRVRTLLWAAHAAWNLAMLEQEQRSQEESQAWSKAGDLWRFLTKVNEKVDGDWGPYNDGNEVQKAAVSAWLAYINAARAYERQSDIENHLKMMQRAIEIDIVPDDTHRDKWVGYSRSAAIAIEKAWQSSAGEKGYWRDAVKAWQQLAAEGLRSGDTKLMDTASAHLELLTEDVEKQSIGSKNWKDIKTEIKTKCEEIIKETIRNSEGGIALFRCRAAQFQLLIALGSSEVENYKQCYECLITAAELAQIAQQNKAAGEFYEKAQNVLEKMMERISVPGELKRLESEKKRLTGRLEALPEEKAELRKSLESIDQKSSDPEESSADITIGVFRLPYIFADVLMGPEHRDEVKDSKGDSYWVNDVRGDGNCFFRAIADQLLRVVRRNSTFAELLMKQLKIKSQDKLNQDSLSGLLRALVDEQINGDEERFEYYNSLEAGQTERLRNIGRNGVWSSDAVVQALVDRLNLRIRIVHLENSLHVVEDVEPSGTGSNIGLTIGFTGNHFVSLLAEGEEFTEVEKTAAAVAQEKSFKGDMHCFLGEESLGEAENPDNSPEESVGYNQKAAEEFEKAAQIFKEKDRAKWRMCRYKYAQARYFEAEGRLSMFAKEEAARCYEEAFRVFIDLANEECDDRDVLVQNGKAWAFWMAARARVGCARSFGTYGGEKQQFNLEAIKLFDEAAERFSKLDNEEMKKRCDAEREKAKQEAEKAVRKSKVDEYLARAKESAFKAGDAFERKLWQYAAKLDLQASCYFDKAAEEIRFDNPDQVDQWLREAERCKAHAFRCAARANTDKAKKSQNKQSPNEQACRYYSAAIELFEQIEGKEEAVQECRKERIKALKYVNKSEEEIARLGLFSISEDKVTLQGKQRGVCVAPEGDGWDTAGTAKGKNSKKSKKPDCYLLPDPSSFMPKEELDLPSGSEISVSRNGVELAQEETDVQSGSASQSALDRASVPGAMDLNPTSEANYTREGSSSPALGSIQAALSVRPPLSFVESPTFLQ